MKIRYFKSINGEFAKEIHEEFQKVFVDGEEFNKKLLSNPKYTSELAVSNGKDLKIKNETHFEVAKAIAESLGGKSKIKTYRENYGLWLWLTFAYSEFLFKYNKTGIKTIEDRANYWPVDVKDRLVAARHRIRGLCMLYAAHGDNADFVLNQPLHTRGDVTETLSQSPEFSDKTIYLTFRKLYWDANKKVARRGHTTNNCGTRDLIAEIKKLMYAHAVELMSVNELLDILHPRFKDKWL